jgi:hypothetical protein
MVLFRHDAPPSITRFYHTRVRGEQTWQRERNLMMKKNAAKMLDYFLLVSPLLRWLYCTDDLQMFFSEKLLDIACNWVHCIF